jgi:hypothetical protein
MAGSFGPPLDLGEVLGQETLDHYQNTMSGLLSVPQQYQSEAEGQVLTLWGTGPDQASSCTEVAWRPEACWDVCGYYAALGVHWKASRHELMRAYHQLGGQDDERLTYILGQLINRQLRAEYDTTWPWELFLADRDMMAVFQKIAQAIARRRSGLHGGEVTASDVMREYGVNTRRYGEERPEDPAERDTPATIQKSLDWLEHWSWYTLGMNEPPEDASKLQEWQRMLVAAFAAKGQIVRFAVGFHPGRSWTTLRLSGGGCIFLIGTEQPTPEEAQKAADRHEAQGETKETLKMPQMTTGVSVPKAADEAAQAARKAGSRRIEQQRFKDNEDVFLRFYTDLPDVLSIDTHRFIPTKPKPKAWKSDNWPKGMWFGCQNDRIFRLRDPQDLAELLEPAQYEGGYGECDIHTRFEGQVGEYNKPVARPEYLTYALVIVQKEVEVGGGRKGFVDDTEEVVIKDGDNERKLRVPKIRYVAQKYTNFFNPLVQSAYMDDTICNKVYKIRREGTEYHVSSLGTTEDHKPGTDAWKAYDEAVKVLGISLQGMILEHSSPEFFAKFLIPQADDDKEPEAEDAGTQVADGNGSAPAASVPASQPSAETQQAMREKLLGGKADAGSNGDSEPASVPSVPAS